MKTLIAALIFCGSLLAQTPGTVTETTVRTVLAVAGTVSCELSNPASPAIRVVCKYSTEVTTTTGTPGLGAASAMQGSSVNAGDSVTWIVQQLTVGVYTYQIAANGTSKSGTF